MYAEITSAAWVNEAKPSGWAVMKARMRSTPAVSQRGVMSTSTIAENRPGQRDSASRPNRPPIDAATSTGGRGCSPASTIRSSANCSP